MKKLLTIVFSFSLAIPLFLAGNVSIFAASVTAVPQVNYLKRKTKKVYHRTKNGTVDIARDSKNKTKKGYHRTERGSRDLAHETKHETKKGYRKTKRVSKHTYHKTKDEVTN